MQVEAVEFRVTSSIDHALDVLDVKPVASDIHVDAAMNEFGSILDGHGSIWSVDSAFRVRVE